LSDYFCGGTAEIAVGKVKLELAAVDELDPVLLLPPPPPPPQAVKPNTRPSANKVLNRFTFQLLFGIASPS